MKSRIRLPLHLKLKVSPLDPIRKAMRFAGIYGLARSYFKVAGRMRPTLRLPLLRLPLKRTVGIIGCGQFAFGTIGYFLGATPDGGISACYDVDSQAAATFAKFYNVPRIANSADEVLSDPNVNVVYIASNHASHADYAIKALRRGLTVYCEKPVAVSYAQLIALRDAIDGNEHRFMAGYNRPLSSAITALRATIGISRLPITLSCFVSGHQLGQDHWYRRPDEGTRICGNVGHWLDLAVHMLCWGDLPDRWRIHLHWSSPRTRDDDIAISLSSDRGDLINIVMTARAEPFEGINETINFQQGSTIAKIDDFRSTTIWKGARVIRKRSWPKDVGHRAAILQPFSGRIRPWREVELSTLLILEITRMVQEEESDTEFSFSSASLALATSAGDFSV